MAMTRRHRDPALRRQLILDAVFAAAFAIVFVISSHKAWRGFVREGELRMKHWFFGKALPAFTFAAVAFASVPAAAATTMVVFGDSLPDSGNAAIAVGSAPGQVITGNTYIPSQPYASGTFSNGPVWASDVAAALGVPLHPSFAGGTNFAVGGATTGGSSPTSLLAQANQYLTLTGGVASSTG